MERTSQRLSQKNYRASISGREDSRVRTFLSAVSKLGLAEAEADCF